MSCDATYILTIMMLFRPCMLRCPHILYAALLPARFPGMLRCLDMLRCYLQVVLSLHASWSHSLPNTCALLKILVHHCYGRAPVLITQSSLFSLLQRGAFLSIGIVKTIRKIKKLRRNICTIY